ncbi:uncharacterized protein LOC141830836 isoform X2 [Curcuma longa]|uniref:uncharacterized protein LOC141830836 isoform X2 n=1 Tax=Curcuma longa TaxID=136217 RepID=UPI003D9E5B55
MGDGEITVSKALALHLLCALGLAAGYFAAGIAYNLSLVTDPTQTLSFLLVFEAPIVVASYSLVRRECNSCSRNSLGRLFPWHCLDYQSVLAKHHLLVMSHVIVYFCVFGWSRMDWQRILANSKPKQAIDCLVSLPAQGAIVGAWLGAWPMPLDWEMPWQEWPICVTYGAIAGYIVGMILSTVFVHVMKNHPHVKDD